MTCFSDQRKAYIGDGPITSILTDLYIQLPNSPAAEGSIHQCMRTKISRSFVTADPEYKPSSSSCTLLFPYTHPPVSLIPSSFTVWQFPYLFVSVICAGSHTLVHAFTVCDWWLDKGLRMERSGWQSSNRKLSVQWVLFMNLQPIFVCLQLHLLATTQSDTQAKCSDTSGDGTCHIRGLFVNRLSLKTLFYPSKLENDVRIGLCMTGEWIANPWPGASFYISIYIYIDR